MRLVLLAAFLLAGCQAQVQTSSGADYLAARPGFNPQAGTEMDQAVARAASAEPLLRFPARFGLARIAYGRITAVPPGEADAWMGFAQGHADYGSFVLISPLIAELTASSAGDVAKSAVDQIRLGAARQHVDAVLIYTVSGSGKDIASPLSLLDLTIVGAYLMPSRSVAGDATASALLVDVRNGYPYGTVSATAHQTDFVPSVGSTAKQMALTQDAQVAAVTNLTAQLDGMVNKLRTQLDEQELSKLRPARAAKL